MRRSFAVAVFCALMQAGGARALAQDAGDAGATAPVSVDHTGGNWTVAGKKNTIVLNEKTLAVSVKAGTTTWNMAPSSSGDVLVGVPGDDFHLRLADAGKIEIAPYHTGYKTGVKLVLDQFRATGQKEAGAPLGIRIVLTLALEGSDEDLVANVMAIEKGLTVRELNWPKEVDGREVDFTVIPSDDGTLLPRNWPKPYHPIHRAAGDHSIIQSHLIESWAMSWWGFEKGDAAMMVIVETPDDAHTRSHIRRAGRRAWGRAGERSSTGSAIPAACAWCFYLMATTST